MIRFEDEIRERTERVKLSIEEEIKDKGNLTVLKSLQVEYATLRWVLVE